MCLIISTWFFYTKPVNIEECAGIEPDLMASVNKMLRNQRSARKKYLGRRMFFYGGGAIPPAQINGWECLFWLIRGISQSWHHLVSLLQLTILTGQGHISELCAISCGFQRKADIIARKRKKLVGFYNQVVYISAYWFLPIHLTCIELPPPFLLVKTPGLCLDEKAHWLAFIKTKAIPYQNGFL